MSWPTTTSGARSGLGAASPLRCRASHPSATPEPTTRSTAQESAGATSSSPMPEELELGQAQRRLAKGTHPGSGASRPTGAAAVQHRTLTAPAPRSRRPNPPRDSVPDRFPDSASCASCQCSQEDESIDVRTRRVACNREGRTRALDDSSFRSVHGAAVLAVGPDVSAPPSEGFSGCNSDLEPQHPPSLLLGRQTFGTRNLNSSARSAAMDRVAFSAISGRTMDRSAPASTTDSPAILSTRNPHPRGCEGVTGA
mmetsp:Transcript_541/g.1194  ORF Transcript_541/g.1194 Transcript_541/m.1194 type:complete len:254 (+) Transcript_541:452-1213(+)